MNPLHWKREYLVAGLRSASSNGRAVLRVDGFRGPQVAISNTLGLGVKCGSSPGSQIHPNMAMAAFWDRVCRTDVLRRNANSRSVKMTDAPYAAAPIGPRSR